MSTSLARMGRRWWPVRRAARAGATKPSGSQPTPATIGADRASAPDAGSEDRVLAVTLVIRSVPLPGPREHQCDHGGDDAREDVSAREQRAGEHGEDESPQPRRAESHVPE